MATRATRRSPVDAPVDAEDRESRGAALAVLRWVLGGAPVGPHAFLVGFGALPPALRPLAADFGLRNLDELEAEAVELLTQIMRGATMRWMAQGAVVREIRSGLDGAGVPAVFLKGVALAEQAYPRPATRPSSDIDLWIRPDDLPVAIAALSTRGFGVPARHGEASDPRGPTPTTYLEAHVAGGPVLLDLHVRPMSLRHLTDEEVWAMWSSRVPVGPSAMPALPLDLQLLHVCLHIARSHGFVSGLKALVDIAMIARAWPDGDLWERFSERVLDVRSGLPVFVCLELARESVGAAIPPALLDRLRTDPARRALGQARALLWAREPKLPLGVTALAGGGLVEPGWLLNRLWLRRHITPEQRRSLATPDRPPPRLVARYFLRRLASLARLLTSSEPFRPSFWKRVRVERRRHRLLVELERLQAQSSRDPIRQWRPGSGADARVE